MKNNPVTDAVRNRRSIRKFQDKKIPADMLAAVLEAGRWAPSGQNTQPWRFAVMEEAAMRAALARLTRYGKIIEGAPACVAVFFDAPSGYNRDKDLMGIGACVQNMLLAAHSLGLGAVWLGQILERKAEVNGLLGLDDRYELMAVVAIGFPAEEPEGGRKELESLVLKRF